MPTKLRYKLLISFCLMSLLPIMVGIYIASLFIKFPFEVNTGNLLTIGAVTFFSLILSYLGHLVTRQIVAPISGVSAVAKNIAAGRFDEPVDVQVSDELEDLSQSLKTITKNAKELLEKVEKLSLKDKLTGLYNATYIRERLDEEIQRAIHYQRPCSFAYFLLDGLNDYGSRQGEKAIEEVLKTVANVFNNHVTEFDRAARVNRDEFVIIFPDRNKKKAVELVQQICGDPLLSPFTKEGKLKLIAGVSEDPIDGVSADQLYLIAQIRLKTARANGQAVEAFA